MLVLREQLSVVLILGQCLRRAILRVLVSLIAVVIRITDLTIDLGKGHSFLVTRQPTGSLPHGAAVFFLRGRREDENFFFVAQLAHRSEKKKKQVQPTKKKIHAPNGFSHSER
jgi:hypothetical protein